MKYALVLALLVSLSFLGVNCSEDTAGPTPADTSYIKILEPKSGAKIRVGEKFKIITESDYDKFGQNLTFAATPDSGRTWAAFISSLEIKTGMNVRDTVVASFDTLYLLPGEKTKIRVIEYDKRYFAIVDNIEIIP